MPLVLSLREGQDFYVGETQFVVDQVGGDVQFTLRHVAEARTFEITDEHATEVMQDVFVSAGPRERPSLARVVIEAPPDVLVLRGDKKRNPPPHVHPRQK